MIELGTKESRRTVGLEPNRDLAAVPSSFFSHRTCQTRSRCAEIAPRAGVDSAAARGHCGRIHRRAASDREEREPMDGQHRVLFRTALAMSAERCRMCAEHTLRAVTSVTNPQVDLPIAAPRRRCPRDAHEKARSHGYIRTLQETRETMEEVIHACARANACTSAANVRKGERGMRKCTRARRIPLCSSVSS